MAGASTYQVYRSTASAIDGQMRLLDESVTATSYDDYVEGEAVGCMGDEPSAYYYWVRARNADGDSAYSAADAGHSGPQAAVQRSAALPAGDVLLLALVAVLLHAAARRQRLAR